jgi:hypothetical protein
MSETRSQLTHIALLPLCLSMTACGGTEKPTLRCELSHFDGSSRSPIDRQIAASLTGFSNEGVWEFVGELTVDGNSDAGVPITGHFFQYDKDKFDLVASAGRERITVMPDNKILKERGLQGVTMPAAGHVSTGIPLSASCQTSLPVVGNQRYEIREKQ